MYNSFGEQDVLGIFGTEAFLQTDINLILQVVTFVVIGISLFYKNKQKFKIHGQTMGIALVLHIITFLAVMLPSFSNAYSYFTEYTSDLGVQTMWIHAVPGAITLILGLFLVVTWALRPFNVAACSKRKRIMDVTVVLWLISLVFGIASYIVFYT